MRNVAMIPAAASAKHPRWITITVGISIRSCERNPRPPPEGQAAIDHWCKELAPSTALRQWFGYEPERWEEFRRRYKAELAEAPEALTEVRGFARKGPITMLFAAHDELRNNAVVVHELLRVKPRAAGEPVKTTGRMRRKT